jgi:hypothetical protein
LFAHQLSMIRPYRLQHQQIAAAIVQHRQLARLRKVRNAIVLIS